MGRAICFMCFAAMILFACSPGGDSSGANQPIAQPTHTAAELPTETIDTSIIPTPLAPSVTLGANEQILSQAEAIIGRWWGKYAFGSEEGYINFSPDGSFDYSKTPDSVGGGSGKFWFEDGELHFTTDFCGESGVYQVHLYTMPGSPTKMRFILIEDECKAQREDVLNHNEWWERFE